MKTLIVGNWKMNPQSLEEAKNIFNSIKKGIKKIKEAEVVICPPFVFLASLGFDKKIKGGCQNIFFEEKGAFTGEISAKMAKSLNLEYAIIGHSERRKYQKETDGLVNKKIKSALENKIKPILCVDKISQIKKGLKGLSRKELKEVIIAYEPLFAIGTGKACSPEKAKATRLLIKKEAKGNNKILYGGSVKADNAASYIKKAGFQGLLVGGASLKPKEFLGIIQNSR